MRSGDLRRFAAPAAFLAAVTLAVVLVRSGLEAGTSSPSALTTVATTTAHRHDVAASTTARRGTKPRRKATARRYYTVAAGDTFSVISSKTGVPVATIERLNPGVSSSTLTIGERLRVR